MNSSYFSRPISNQQVRRRKQGNSWWIYVAIAIGCMISYGFVAAARNHFNAMALGYQSEALKHQRTQLEQDQRKLTLELSRRLAPQRFNVRAEHQGLTLPSNRQTVAVQQVAGQSSIQSTSNGAKHMDIVKPGHAAAD